MRGARDTGPGRRGRGSGRKRRPLFGLLLSVGVHGALLLGLSRVAPRFAEPTAAPPLEMRIVSPVLRSRFAATPAQKIYRVATPRPTPPRPSSTPLPVRPAPLPLSAQVTAATPPPRSSTTSAPSAPFFVDSLLGCRREDLILMSPEQRRRCESWIAAARSPGWMRSPLACSAQTLRKLAGDDRAACDRRLMALYAKGAEHAIDRISAEKRAEYDAAAAAQAQRRAGVRGMLDPGSVPEHCPGSNFGMGCLSGRAEATTMRILPLPGMPASGPPPP